ncbi:Galactose oxidase, central domain family protein [Aspergillus niger]|uniref:Elongation factor 1-alpha n=1 Tax=Aspergillus niger TaxID=5061 RepID=A0A505HY45_ASPNG|nr:Galactose oxidase, central domain family protein [Aspergillus niger]
MADQTPDSWEDELSRQTEGVRLNPNAQGRPQPQAPSFHPGAATFTPGAASFVPGQAYQPYGGGFPQYGQYGQQAYGGYPYDQQQQAYAQYGAYAQQPGGFNNNQIYNQQYGDTKGAAAVEAAAKVTASKAIEKTEKKADAKAAASGKSSPTPSGRSSPGRSSPARGEAAKAARNADAVAMEQQADVDEATLKEIYGEKKEHVNIVFIGHVDAGKSTLGGSILYVTGMVDERTLEKYKRDAKEAGRETWYLSWALDLTNEERAKGKTVEVGRAHFQLPVKGADGSTITRHFSILDAPGHKSYVHHMIGGASQADVGVLVISARKGEYETGFEKGGQTREHALLARNTGVKTLIVAVNKMDDPTVEWSKARFDECTVKVGKYLENLGYKKSDLFFMPISAQRTTGIKDRVPTDLAPWYGGPSLLEFLSEMKVPERKINAPFMMPISAKYRDMGTMVEGRIESGVLKKNGSCIMMPNRTKVEIAALYGETEDEIPTATCGDQVRLRLRGVEEEDILPGFVLCSPKRLVNCVKTFEAKIRILDLKSILTAGYNCVMHVHSAVEEVTVAALLHKCEPGTGRRSKRPPPFASKGQTIIARLEVTSTAGAVCVERFEDYNQMGRFTLRDQGQTVAIGMITKLISAEEVAQAQA